MSVIPAYREEPGRLLDAKEVAAELFNGKVTPRWVRDKLMYGRVPRVGPRLLWAESAVKQWIADQVERPS